MTRYTGINNCQFGRFEYFKMVNNIIPLNPLRIKQVLSPTEASLKFRLNIRNYTVSKIYIHRRTLLRLTKVRGLVTLTDVVKLCENWPQPARTVCLSLDWAKFNLNPPISRPAHHCTSLHFSAPHL